MLTGKKVLVIGLARSGKAAVKLLQKLNATITINEGKELEKIEGYQAYLDAGIEIVAGGHPDELFERDFDFVPFHTNRACLSGFYCVRQRKRYSCLYRN